MGLATRPASTRCQPASSRCSRCSQMMRRRGGDLSGGQQQQLAIGRPGHGAELLILDEPTRGIQPSIIKDIERAIRALAETGEMAILLVEQLPASPPGHHLLMERGEIISAGRRR